VRLRVTSTLVEAVAGTRARFVITCAVTSGELRAGERLRVELPKSWHVGPKNSARRVQATDPNAPDYVSASAQRSQATLTCTVEGQSEDEFVKSMRPGLDGTPNRYVFVTRVDVTAGSVRAGESIEVSYGAFGAAPHPQGDEAVGVIAETSEGAVIPDERPRIRVVASEPVELVCHAPSVAAVGERVELRVIALDSAGNAARLPGPIRMVAVDGPASVDPEDVRHDDQRALVPVRLGAEGVVRVRVAIPGVSAAVSDPVLVRTEPTRRIFWGDLHSHATESFDGTGQRPFDYARDVACLDFYALTEHAEGWRDGAWARIREAVAGHDRDGEFVVLPGYEATFPSPWGHHNVYFRGADGPVLGALDGTLPDLWHRLAEGEALTVPHHTGVEFLRPLPVGGFRQTSPVAIDWSHHDPALRTIVEIYSAHGQSELFDPEHPLAYERSDFQFNRSARGPHYAQDAWRLGHWLGTIASSDDHHGQPGRGEYGLVAVAAPSLTRGSIFDALRERACYATTGARMIVELNIAGATMGQEATAADGQMLVAVRVHGTATIAFAEIVALPLGGGEAVVARWEPGSADLVTEVRIPGPGLATFYYLRARQTEPYRGRAVQAWTSPVRVTPASRSKRETGGISWRTGGA
jgi:hypothetical protein